MSAMRAKALSLLQVYEDKEKDAKLALQREQQQKQHELAALRAAKASKKWPMIKHLYALLGDFAALPEDMAIAVRFGGVLLRVAVKLTCPPDFSELRCC
jgi:hypothetical protein